MGGGSSTVSAVTECSTKDVQFQWTIKNFSFLNKKCGEYSESPEFSVQSDKNSTKWVLQISPNGEWCADVKCDHNDITLIYLKLVDSNLETLKCQIEFKAMTSSWKEIFTCPNEVRRICKNQRYEYRCVKRSEIQEAISKDDVLLLTCSLKVHDDEDGEISLTVTEPRSSIIDDLANLRMNCDFSDVNLRVSKTEFRAHKCILAARSPVFSSMFSVGMREAKLGRVQISDIRPHIFEELLNFIYTGKAKVEENAAELLAAADKYQVLDLKAFCEKVLIQKISIENCLNTLILSDLYSVKLLKESTLNFIATKRPAFIKNGLGVIKNQMLLKEIIEALSDRN